MDHPTTPSSIDETASDIIGPGLRVTENDEQSTGTCKRILCAYYECMYFF